MTGGTQVIASTSSCDRIGQQSRNEKIAFKLEEGRVYGLRQQYYDFILQRQLGREMQKSHTEPHW